MVRIFVGAFALGLIFNIAPGAVFAETLRRGLRGGFRPAFAVQVGSLVGDGAWAILGLGGVGLLLQLETLRIPVGILGALYLLWLSWDAWRAADTEVGLEADGTAVRRSALRAGVLLSVTNPQNVGYWAAIGSALGAIGVQDPGPAEYTVYFAGFMTASIAWAFACAALVDVFSARAGVRWARLTYRACAAAFLAMGVSAVRDLWSGARGPAPHAPLPLVTPQHPGAGFGDAER
jgi:chemosensory pili system protein ChpE/L-lysine exporter family protein LysE/ArgO